MSKRGETKNISKVIEDVFSQKHFRIGIDNIKVQEAWLKTMGKNIQKYTYKVVYKKGILYVKLKSSVLKEELTFEKMKVINLLNKELGKEYIKNIVIN
ncbi:MAG: RNA-binding protein [Flavobacteriaceae bacterium]|nr:RNA-binding protein [Flavobacteriaceae bacterium]